MQKFLYSLLLLTWILPVVSQADNALTRYAALRNAGLLAVDGQGRKLVADQVDRRFIPASTTKLVTAWLALSHWGENHRFTTRFFLDKESSTLWVKGSGDPYLVSEELQLIAKNLKQRGLLEIRAIGLDTTFFQPALTLPGTGNSNNPYDAVSTAVAANFNTINFKRLKGRWVSAESQTPLTGYAIKQARQFNYGNIRVNTGPNPRNAEIYFAELLAAILRKEDINVGYKVIFGTAPSDEAFYTHVNSRNLADMIRPMLKYSTNFIANQLILILSAEYFGRPANAADVKRYMQENMARRLQWQHFTLEEGAGLSYENRLSPTQLVELLEAFRPWKHLMPEIEPGVFAKTGTLKSVSTLAGYIVHQGDWEPFALMMNQSVPDTLRNQIAVALAKRKNRPGNTLSKL